MTNYYYKYIKYKRKYLELRGGIQNPKLPIIFNEFEKKELKPNELEIYDEYIKKFLYCDNDPKESFTELLNKNPIAIESIDVLQKKIFDIGKTLVNKKPEHVLKQIENIMKILENKMLIPNKYKKVLFFPNIINHDIFLSILASAKESLDICVFTITDKNIFDILQKLNNNIKIRVISDMNTSLAKGSIVQYLKNINVPVRLHFDEKVHMHNKFCIIDNKYLITGSYNWTNAAYKNNNENILILEEPYFINEYQKEFDKLWNMFDPKNKII